MKPLMYVGQQAADTLKNNLEEYLPRYRAGDFTDLEQAGDWRIQLSVHADLEQLSELDPSSNAQAEAKNSILVGSVLKGLTPSLAREDRLWIRLSHIDALEYARNRWLKVDMSDETLAKQVRAHFFAPTLTSSRDDHAISRLWWNYHIACKIMPDDPGRALESILARADIRQAIIERSGIGMRTALTKGIVRMIEDNSTGLRADETLFREFIKKINLRGAGIIMEVCSSSWIDEFMKKCLDEAIKDD